MTGRVTGVISTVTPVTFYERKERFDMSIRHEQLKKNVEISRERLDHARVKRLESVSLHKRYKVLNIVFWVVGPISAGVIAMTFAWWLLMIWFVAFAITARWAWNDLLEMRSYIHHWHCEERKHLSQVADDIQALVDRETLQLMNPSAYNEIEDQAKRVAQEKEDERYRILEARSRGRLTMPRYVPYDMCIEEW